VGLIVRKRLLQATAFTILLVFALGLRAETCGKLSHWRPATIDENTLLISLLRVNNNSISAAFDVYPYKNTYLIPVQALDETLRLGWQIDSAASLIASPKNAIDSSFCEFSLAFAKLNTEGGYFWAKDDFDIYIDIDALAVMLGGSVNYDFRLLQLNITVDGEFKGLSEKQQGIPSFTARSQLVPDRVIDDEYRLFTPPLINYQLNGRYDSKEDGGSLTANVNGFFDLGQHATELRVNASDSDSRQFLKFSKNLDITGENGAINYLRYEVGDIQLQSDELIYRSKQAAGVSIFNFDPTYTRSFSQVTIEETVLPGWRAQLFRNGQFLAEKFSDSENRVVFDEVETFYGSNLFEIKLYGPEGQQEVREQTINVGKEQLSPGGWNYYFNVSDAGKRFIDNDSDEALYDKNISGLLSYGLSSSATVEVSAHSLRGLDTQRDYVSSALYMNFASSALKTQVVKDIDGGSAVFAGINSSFGRDLRAKFSGRYFNDFVSDAYPESRDIQGEAQLRLNGRAKWWEGVSWSSSLTHRAYYGRDDSNTVTASVSKNLFGGTFSSAFNFNDQGAESLQNRLYFSKNIYGWQVSNSLDWLPADEQKIVSFYSNIRWPQSYATYNESRLEYRADSKDKLLLRHRFNWRQDSFNLQFGASVSDSGEWTVNLGISGDIEYDPFTPEINFYRPRGGSIANIQAMTYLDNNRNSVFDEEDEVLTDVGFTGNQAWRDRGTNDQGNIQLYTGSRSQSIHIDDTSLPDPFMHPVDELVYVNTHRGGVNRVALPVVTFNDLEGAVYRVKNSNSRGVSGLKVMLVDEALNVVAETTTEVDGFFFFSRIPPGKYNLQVEAEYMSANNLIIANLPEMINAPKRGDSLRINDLLLVDKDQEPQLVANAQVETQADSVATALLPDRFYVQLGAFKKPRSIIEVIKYLPTEEYDLKIYRNHSTALSYVVMGGYDTLHEARAAIAKIRDVTQFTEAYVNNGSRYFQKGWTLEYQLHDIQSHLLETHEVIKTAPQQSYFCQLASYRSLTSIAQEKFNGVVPVYVARRLVKQKRFYTLYSGPVLDPLACGDKQYADLTPERPIPLATPILRTQLADNSQSN
jgi:hypothetical protein